MNRVFFLTMLVLVAAGQAAWGQTYPGGFSGTDLATELWAPTCFCIAPEGIIYICEQIGTLRVWKEGTGLLPNEFFLNNPLTVGAYGERGLIGVAVDPGFATNRYIYVYYTATTPAEHNRISRFTASADGELAIAGSEAVLLELNNVTSDRHNGGALHFGLDGMLYAGVGEHGVGSNSQSINNLLGKILRINPNPGSVIPPDNPTNFPGIAGSPTGDNRAIWAVGLRNPFTFAFHPLSGRMFINDVGAFSWEEIDDGIAGRNYGWPSTEGNFNQLSFPNFTLPLYTYSHSVGPVTGHAITGGEFYVPQISSFPTDYYGDYFFGDYGSGWIKRIDVNSSSVTNFGNSTYGVVDLRIDSQGRVVYLARDVSKLIRVSYATEFAPTFTTQPSDQMACLGDTVQLSVSVASNPAPSFSWRRNGIALSDGGNVSGAATPMLTISAAQPADGGAYDCFIQNTQGDSTSNAALLTVGVPGTGYDGQQIQPFASAVVAQSNNSQDICWYDFSGDDVVDLTDVDSMVAALLGL